MVDSGVDFETWEMGASSMTLRWRGRGVLEVVVRVHGHEELGPIAVRRMDAVLSDAGKIAIFLDFTDSPGYDSGLRVLWTQWLQSHLRSITKMHIVVKSKMVAMGVSVANLALGGIIQTHSQRAGAYERLLDEAIRGKAK
jgi:hypothetical protein